MLKQSIKVMEALSEMMQKLMERGAIERFDVGGGGSGGVSISHLLFVDDPLILCKADENHIRNLICLLLCFEAVSGLRSIFPNMRLFLLVVL